MIPFRSDLPMNLITMLLIVLGGLGFFVWFDAAEAFRECLKKKIGIRGFFSRLHEHTKLVLTVTLIHHHIQVIILLLQLLEAKNHIPYSGSKRAQCFLVLSHRVTKIWLQI